MCVFSPSDFSFQNSWKQVLSTFQNSENLESHFFLCSNKDSKPNTISFHYFENFENKKQKIENEIVTKYNGCNTFAKAINT